MTSDRPAEDTDPLTGLLNWRVGRQKLEQAIAEARQNNGQLCLVLADIDRMHLFNDKYGHILGDEVIKKWAGVIQSLAGEDNIVCRIGGDEFVIIMPSASPEAARTLAEQIRGEASRTSMESKGQQLAPLTMTLGIARFPEDGKDVDALLKAADEAMYQGKLSGRNCVFPEQ